MSALPEALRPWAGPLSLFPEDLALCLGGHVARLAAVLGPMRARSEAQGGEPQGYDGLTRRGSPERLLMSEWVMALEAPEEFLRRAAFGEQSFLRPAFRQPQGGQRTVVLLDAGPDQFGPPRIAHLALLVVLARRAESAGAGFVWGVLQSPPPREPTPSVNPSAVGQWLKACSPWAVKAEHLAAWREALDWGRAHEDVWLVGSPRLARLPGAESLSRVAVDEVLVPGVRRLSVEVRPASRPPREVRLELPPESECVRLLRDPFLAIASSPVVAAAPAQSLRFSADGLRLLLSFSDGGVAAQVLPNSPRDTVPRPKRFQPPRDESVVALGWRRTGGLLVLTRATDGLRVHGTLRGRPAGHVLKLPQRFLAERPYLPSAGEPPLLLVSRVSDGVEIPLLVDAQRQLLPLIDDPSGPAPYAPLLQSVSALAEFRGHFFFVGALPGENTVESRIFGWLDGKTWPLPEGLFTLVLAHVGLDKDANPNHGRPPLATSNVPSPWLLWGNAAEPTEPTLGPGARVVGLYRWPVYSEPELVVLDPDERTFRRVHAAGHSEVLVTSPARVVSSVVSTALPHLAWLTDKGEVCAWSFHHRAFIFRSIPGARS